MKWLWETAYNHLDDIKRFKLFGDAASSDSILNNLKENQSGLYLSNSF